MTWADVGPVIVALGLAVGGALFLRRYGGGTALEQLERANRILERRVRELEALVSQLVAENAALQAKTDLTEAFAPTKKLLADQHAEAMGRFNRIVDLLGLIGDRLGPELDVV